MAGEQVPIGAVIMWADATTSVPTDFVECNGQELSRAGFAVLFALLGEVYGNGDGSTTFNVPDFGGRMPIGSPLSAPPLTDKAVGAAGGVEEHTLLTAEIPSHQHSPGLAGASTRNSAGDHGGIPSGTAAGVKGSPQVDTTPEDAAAGGGGAHENMPPFLGIVFLIRTAIT